MKIYRTRTPEKIILLRIITVLLGLVPAPAAWSHEGHIPVLGTPPLAAARGPVSVQACGHSEHMGQHNNTQPVRRDYTTGKGDDVRAVVVNNQKGLLCQTLSELTTPFSGVMRATARPVFMQNNRQYFEDFAYVEMGWGNLQVIPALAELWASCWIAVTNRINEPTEAHDTQVTSALAKNDLEGWRKLKPLEEFVALATSIPNIDNNGVSWQGTKPAVAYILASQVVSEKGVVGIEYQLTNKTPGTINFLFSQITTPAFPTGWTGELKGRSTATVSIALNKPEALYIQKTQAYFWSDEDPGGYQAVPLHMYVNEAALEFKGRITYLKADFNPARNATRLKLRIEGDSADGAVIYRNSSNGLELIKRIDQTIETGTDVIVTDFSPPDGRVSYRVKAGRGVNGRYSENISVSIPKPNTDKEE